jgi:hypothetical protein
MFADFAAVTATQWVIILSVVAVCFLLSAWTILDAWKRDFEAVNEKVLWMQICIFVPIIGSLAYLFVGRKRGNTRA